MKKSLLAIAALAAGFTMSAQQTVFFSDDFEWLAPWADAGNAGNVMVDQDMQNTAPNLLTKATVNDEEVECIAALEEKGYKFEAWNNSKKDPRVPAKQIYLQKNYLKFGLTGYQSGIYLPAIKDVPAGTTCTLNFDACSQKRTKEPFPYDPTHIVVEVFNGEESVVFNAIQFETPDNAEFAWTPVSVKLEGVAITETTKILIRNADDQLGSSSALRYYLDNLSVTAEATGIDAVIADENAPVEYFNLQGIRVNEPANGLFIRRQGNAVTKVMVK